MSDSARPPPLTAAAAAAATASNHPRLYRDVLTSVLAFVTLRELAVALSVSKEWTAAVQTMRPVMLAADIPSKPLTALLLSSSSPLLRHVGQLGHRATSVLLYTNQLDALCHALPQLLSLSTRLNMQPSGASLLFPPRLQQLHLFSYNWPDDANDTAMAFLAAIGQLQQLHTLHLYMRYEVGSLAPLQQLPLLRELVLFLPVPLRLEQFASDLRALHWLHRLHIHLSWAVEQSHRASLCTALLHDAPEEELCTLQWRDFDINSLKFTDELTPLLLRLPLLERLEAHLSRCSRFEFLAGLPRLTDLEVQFGRMRSDVWRNLLSVFTSDGLIRLCALKLDGGPCTSDDLTQLFSHTPSLTSLVLCTLPQVSSLSFFRQLPKLADTLTQLTLDCTNPSLSWRLTAAALPPLHALQQLRELRLIGWPNTETDILTVEDRAPFEQRPCTVLPHLEVFEWTMED